MDKAAVLFLFYLLKFIEMQSQSPLALTFIELGFFCL